MLSRLLRLLPAALSPLNVLSDIDQHVSCSSRPKPTGVSFRESFPPCPPGSSFHISLRLRTSSASTCNQVLLTPCSISIFMIDICSFGDIGPECSHSKIPAPNSPQRPSSVVLRKEMKYSELYSF